MARAPRTRGPCIFDKLIISCTITQPTLTWVLNFPSVSPSSTPPYHHDSSLSAPTPLPPRMCTTRGRKGPINEIGLRRTCKRRGGWYRQRLWDAASPERHPIEQRVLISIQIPSLTPSNHTLSSPRLNWKHYPYSTGKISLRCKQAFLPNKMSEFRNSALRFGVLNLKTIHKVGILKF